MKILNLLPISFSVTFPYFGQFFLVDSLKAMENMESNENIAFQFF